MQPTNKPIQFNGTAGDYFVVAIVSVITYYIILIGWPIGFNYMARWVVENLTVDGKQFKYSAGYGEVFVFLLINMLLVMVTLGIYTFWFVPKTYRFIADHTTYADGTPVNAQPAQAQPMPPVPPVVPTQPVNPVQ